MAGDRDDGGVALHDSEEKVWSGLKRTVVGGDHGNARRPVTIQRATDGVVMDHIHAAHRGVRPGDVRHLRDCVAHDRCVGIDIVRVP